MRAAPIAKERPEGFDRRAERLRRDVFDGKLNLAGNWRDRLLDGYDGAAAIYVDV
jgi:hypothetical protein